MRIRHHLLPVTRSQGYTSVALYQATLVYMDERWLPVPVPSFENLYEVSNMGHVRSLPRVTRSGTRGGRVLKPVPKNKYGHLKVTLSRPDGPNVTVDVHWLVTRAFFGQPKPGEEACHGLGPVSDNSTGNLSYGTPARNQQDRLRDGTDGRGSKNGNALLLAQDVREIRRRYETGEQQTALAQEFQVSLSAVNALIRRRTWAWLP
jgi:hypothetical protein